VIDYRDGLPDLSDVAAVARLAAHARRRHRCVRRDRRASRRQLITPNTTSRHPPAKMFIEEAHAYRIALKNGRGLGDERSSCLRRYDA
jgi:hypothetical protein